MASAQQRRNGFVDVTESSGIRTPRNGGKGRPGQVAAFRMWTTMGDLDVYTGYNADGSRDETSELMISNGAELFSLVIEQYLFVAPLRKNRQGLRLWTITWMGN